MRAQATQLRRDIEAQLANRIAGALSPVPVQAPRLHPTGIAHLDGLLGGGFPLASVCELTGPEGSGQTSITLALLSTATRESACAYIDVSNRLSPQSAAAAGIELGNLLWVRLGTAKTVASAEIGANLRQPAQDISGERRPMHTGCGGHHPRNETKALAPALQQMLARSEERRIDKNEGTHGHPNQPLGLHTASKEQVDWERFNLRRVDETDPLRIMDKRAAEAARQTAAQASARLSSVPLEQKPLDRLDRALRATEQVLQSGGFRVVVLDLASVNPQEACRIPSATWFRFRRAAQESDAILLVLTQEPCARSSAACVLACSAGGEPVVQGVLHAAPRSAEVARQRTALAYARKAPGRDTRWDAAPAWMRSGRR